MAIDSSATFGDRLKQLRMTAGLTQEELAERAGLSVRGISDLERGRRTTPHYETVRLLADALALNAVDRANLLAAAHPREPTHGAVPDPPSNLPTPLTSLIGRASECRELGRLLTTTGARLVTVTGPGGVGKTRLALAAASEARDAFPDGVAFVSLAALRDPALVLATVAHTLGLAETSDEPASAKLRGFLRSRRLLLLLDNFEHLLGAAPALHDLLTACPDLAALVTSRVPLHLSGEHEYAIAPLALPEPGPPATLARLLASPAAALFLERRAAITPRPALTDLDAPVVAEICARLDGLPLAIELAVARSRTLSLPELAARLQPRLRLLTHGPRDLPARQQTLRDTIAWSYDLLAQEEQRLFRWLAVFAGGWTLETADALAAGVPGMTLDVLDGLETLADSSLVRIERGSDGHTRYGMLETIREFAEERLEASGEADDVRRRHADVMLAFTDRAERGLQSGERTAWSRASLDELNNVRAALRWSLDQDETERALRMVGNLDWFWDAVARDREGWDWSQAALTRPSADRTGWGYARTLYAAGQLAWNMGEFARSIELLTESIARFRTLDDARSLGQALLGRALSRAYLGGVAAGRADAREGVEVLATVDDPWNLGLAQFILGEIERIDDLDAARAAYERSLAIFRSIDEPWGIAHAISGLGGLAMRRRDYATARTLLEEGLALRRAVNNPGAIAASLTSLGELARRAGDDARARRFLDEGLTRFRDVGDAEHVAWTLYNLGMLAARREEVAAAVTAFAECLALRAAQGNAAEIAKTIAGAARVTLLRGEPERAATLAGAAEKIRATHTVAAPADEDGEEEQRTAVLIHAALGDARSAEAFAAGRSLALPDALQLAEEVLRLR